MVSHRFVEHKENPESITFPGNIALFRYSVKLSLGERFDSLKSPEIRDLCMVVLHMCCMQRTVLIFPKLLITLTKKGLLL